MAEKKQNAEVKKKTEYSLVDMNLAKGNKIFLGDHEINDVKDADMIRRKDAQARDELSKRILEKDKQGKHKLTKHNMNGVVLTEEEKLQLMPDLKNQSRMRYLDKREKETLQKVKAIIKDEKQIFDDAELTIKELKMRHLKEKITVYAEKNTVEKKTEEMFRVPETADEDNKPAKDKKTKALYGRYEDVPNVLPDNQAWQKSQNDKTKGGYRTIDDIELKSKKNYEILINNPIKFIKNDIISKAKKEAIQIEDDSQSQSSEGEESDGEQR